MSAPECRDPRGDAAHLLTCPDCRARERVAAAWQALAHSAPGADSEPSDAFVRTTLSAITRDRRLRTRRRLALAAAAALLFFFCVGTGHEIAGTPQPSPDEAYASLLAPSTLAGLIPD